MDLCALRIMKDVVQIRNFCVLENVGGWKHLQQPGSFPKHRFGLGFAAFGIWFQFLPLLAKCSVSCWYFTDLKSNSRLVGAPCKNIGESWHSAVPKFLIVQHPPPRIFWEVSGELVGTLHSCEINQMRRRFLRPNFVSVLVTAVGEEVEGPGKKVKDSHCWKILKSYDDQSKMCHCCTPQMCVYKYICISKPLELQIIVCMML